MDFTELSYDELVEKHAQLKQEQADLDRQSPTFHRDYAILGGQIQVLQRMIENWGQE